MIECHKVRQNTVKGSVLPHRHDRFFVKKEVSRNDKIIVPGYLFCVLLKYCFSKNGFYVLNYCKIRYTYRRINSRKVER